jgi:hypothetical protein
MFSRVTGWRKLTLKSIAEGGYTDIGVYSGERFVTSLKLKAHLSCSVKQQFTHLLFYIRVTVHRNKFLYNETN